MMVMQFEWDEAKRLANLDKHGIDFVDAQGLIDGRPIVTTHSAYTDEERYITTGIIEGRFMTVIWTRRNNQIRIISARRSRDAEERAYRALHGG
jgi:uncharacterized DUF497 family protein